MLIILKLQTVIKFRDAERKGEMYSRSDCALPSARSHNYIIRQKGLGLSMGANSAV